MIYSVDEVMQNALIWVSTRVIYRAQRCARADVLIVTERQILIFYGFHAKVHRS